MIRKRWLILVLSVLLFAAACSEASHPSTNASSIPLSAIKETVIQAHDRNQLEKIAIVSITHENGYYSVKWKRPSNCEAGTDYVNDVTGKIEKGETSIC